MKKTILVWAAGCALAISVASFAIAADIVGSVIDAGGNAVPNSKISIANQAGQVSGQAVTDQQGRYAVGGLPDGQYNITLDPAGANSRGDTAVSYLGAKGLTVNWSVGPSRQPIATAQTGTMQAAVTTNNSVVTADSSSPPGCKGKIGPPCGPKSPKD